MKKAPPKRDINQLAKSIVDMVTGEKPVLKKAAPKKKAAKKK